ncbi:MAG: flagellar hook capping protein, partial [Planctomycetes bacterium]|nr:flagellar hook capping protein [Planctomycetota bacterium]
MELTSITSNVASSVADRGAQTLDGLTGNDFLQLLITQLTNQDPL